MREFRSSGSVRGVPSNGHPYRDTVPNDTTALSTKRSFSFAAKLLRAILIP